MVLADRSSIGQRLPLRSAGSRMHPPMALLHWSADPTRTFSWRVPGAHRTKGGGIGGSGAFDPKRSLQKESLGGSRRGSKASLGGQRRFCPAPLILSYIKRASAAWLSSPRQRSLQGVGQQVRQPRCRQGHALLGGEESVFLISLCQIVPCYGNGLGTQ